jgi:hypothetical protein
MGDRRERLFGALCAAVLASVLLFGGVTSASTGVIRAGAAAVLPYPLTATTPAAYASEARIEAAVREGLAARALSSNATPTIAQLAARVEYGNSEAVGCPGLPIGFGTFPVTSCVFGDTGSHQVMVLEGDSRAQMWFDAVDAIAKATHHQLVFLAKGGCPSAMASISIDDGTMGRGSWPQCDQWHRFVLRTLAALHPDVVITTSQPSLALTGTTTAAPPATAEADFLAFYRAVPASAHLVVLGGFPEPILGNPTLCLSRGPADIRSCTWVIPPRVTALNEAVRAAARAAHALYIDQSRWLCFEGRCPAVIEGMIPYTIDGYHLDRPYSVALTGVLWTDLLPVLGR